MTVKIQVKVYDETGKRCYTRELKIPVTIEQAINYYERDFDKLVDHFQNQGELPCVAAKLIQHLG